MSRRWGSLLLCLVLVTLLFPVRALAAPVVWLTPVGGDTKTNSGFTVTVTGIATGDEVKIRVATLGGTLVEEFEETTVNPFLDRRFLFTEADVKGDLRYIVTVNGSQIYDEAHRVYLGTGPTDGQNAGHLSALLDKSLYREGDEGILTVTLTGIEQYAYGDVTIAVAGSGMTLIDAPTMPIDTLKANASFKVKFEDLKLKNFNLTASWGGRGYTITIPVPVLVVSGVQHELSVLTSPSEGGTATGGGSKYAGDVIELTATPKEGYRFVKWESTVTINNKGGSTNAAEVTMPDSALIVTAVFEPDNPTYTLATASSPAEGGTTSGGGAYTSSDTATITATPNSGYKFTKWVLTGSTPTLSSDSAQSATITNLTKNTTATAQFEKISSTKYTLTAKASPSSGGSVTGGGSYIEGTVVTLKAIPSSGYKFEEWTVNGTGDFSNTDVNVNATYTMTGSNATVTAVFVRTESEYHNLTTRQSPSGTGTTSGGGSYIQGEVIRIRAYPTSGYEFDRWEVTGGGSIDSRYSSDAYFTMPNVHATVTAIFVTSNTERDKYRLYVEADTGGRVNAVNDTFAEEYRVRIEAYPNEGYTFDRWETSRGGTFDSNTSSSTYFRMPANTVTVTAKFTKNITLHKISTIAGIGGTLLTDRTGEYEEGTKLALTAQPAEGFRFVNWTTNSGGTFENSTLATTTYTTPNKTAIVTANFAAIPKPTLTIKTEGGGTTTGGGSFSPQEKVNIVATPASNYTFKEWRKEAGDSIVLATNTANGSVTMGSENTILVAVFEAVPTPTPEPSLPPPVVATPQPATPPVVATPPPATPSVVLPKTSSIALGTFGAGLVALVGLYFRRRR